MRAIWNISHMHMAVSDEEASLLQTNPPPPTDEKLVLGVQMLLIPTFSFSCYSNQKHPDPAMAGCRTDKSLVQSFIGQETIPGHFQRDVITHYNIIINITWAVFLLLMTQGGLSRFVSYLHGVTW